MGDHVEGKVIVITGAGGGFGRLVTQKCTARGAHVVAADVDEAGLAETVASTEGSPGRALAVPTDVTKLAEMRALAARWRGVSDDDLVSATAVLQSRLRES